MAEDKLIFQIGFDLEKGVKEAQKNADGYLRRIEDAIKKHPISVELQLEQKSGLSSTVKAETQRAAKELTGLKKEMAAINQEWNALSAKDRGGEVGARLMVQYRALKQEANGYISTVAAAVKEEDRLARQREKSANAAAKAAQKTREYNKELQEQDGYLSRLIKRIVVYAGYSYIHNFIVGIREVTAEFELQRVSLGAIIQDQQRANQLFSEIKSFALKSPIKILDLTKYVKQVAAYRIETDKLFDTTKRLADVSVGLGVDMGRLVLAYGQVKAASYLRAAEIRQFTEAGIPMLELLAEKFTEIQGKAVSTEQVMDMVSKRAVSFSMVEEIFKDMTDAGGMFYNMQEKQAQTLFGMWSKLGDAAAVMYEQIGNTGWINDSLKAGIGLLESMMRNWRDVTSWIGAAGVAFLIFKGNQSIMKMMQVNTIAAADATRNYAIAQEQLNSAKRAGNTLSAKVAEWRKKAAQMNRIAANSTNIWTVANYKLRASFLSLGATMKGNWVSILLSVIMSLVRWLISARQEANRLNNELSKISSEGANKADEMARNFERLAKVVVESADGSKRQNEALEELKRTYSDVIPAQDLTVKKLRAMKGAYDEVTKAIREKIYQQNLEQQLSTIQENYSGKIAKGEEKTRTLLKGYGLSSEEVGRVMAAIRKAINDGLLNAKDDIQTRMDIIGKIIEDQTGKNIDFMEAMTARNQAGGEYVLGYRISNDFWKLSNTVTKIIRPTAEMNAKIKEQTEYTNGLSDSTGRYSGILKDVAKNVAAFSSTLSTSSNEYKLEREQYLIEQYANGVRALFEDAAKHFPAAAKINIDDFFVGGDINWDAATAAAEKAAPQFKKALSKLKNAYEESLPRIGGWKEELQGFSKVVDGLNMGKPIKLFDDTTINGFNSLYDALEEVAKQYKTNKALAEQYAKTLESKTISDETRAQTEELKAEAEARAELDYAALERFNALKLLRESGSGGSDPRLQNLKEEISLVQKLYNEYKQLEEQEGATKAAADMEKLAGETIKGFSDKYNISLPKTAEDLTSALEILYKKMAKLPKNVFPALEKDLRELRWTIEKVDIDESQQNIEKQLKELADKISRTKTAKDFFNKILEQTGDINFATNVSMSIYGDTGEGLFEATVKQIQETFKSNNPEVKIDLSGVIDMTNQRINYGELGKLYEKYQNVISEANHTTAENIIKEGQKTAAENILTWQKELAKAKDFEQQRTDIINRETQRRAEIIKSNLPQEEKQQMVSLSYDKQAKELADLNVKEFKGSDDFIKMFENLDKVATSSLKRMREEIERVIKTDKDMSPENMKAMVDALEKIEDQINGRGFGNVMIQSVKDYIQATKNLHEAQTELKAAQAEYKAQEPKLDADIATAKQEKDTADADVVEKERVLLEIKQQEEVLRQQEIIDETQLAILRDKELDADMALVNAQLRQNIAAGNVAQAEEKKAKAAQKVKNAEKQVTDEQDAQREATSDFFKDLNHVAKTADELAGEFSNIKDFLGVADDSAAGLAFDSAIAGLQQMSSLIGIITTAQELYNAVTESNPWIAIAAAVLAVTSALAFGIGQAKVRKANKEIEKQQEILDQLEYSYGRLEKAAEKAFGGDYIKNFKDQQANLQAQIAATEKQLAAERSKGKKADDEKIKEYEEKIRDMKDQLADMQGALAEHFLGTDLTSAARDFAKAWLDAYKEFGKTADAMSEKFQEMIENMVVEGAMAAVMERALKPMFDMIDEMGDEDFYSQDFWREVTEKAKQGVKDADAGASTLMKFLEGAGISIRDLGGDLTGISRDIASASEESINGLAATMNTWSYYVSYVPQIAQNVAALRAILEGGVTPIQSGQGVTDLVTLQNQSLTHLQDISRHTAETVTECQRIAERCTAMAEDIHRVVVPKGTKGNYAVQTQQVS